MAWRYRGPRGWVSKGTYKRYKHLDTYRRLSDAKWTRGANAPLKGEQKEPSDRRATAPSKGTAPSKRTSAPSASSIKTLKDWNRYYDEYDFSPEFEAETGVDY